MEMDSEPILTPDAAEEDNEEQGVSLEEWMESRDAELMEAYTAPPIENDRATKSRQTQRKTQSREVNGPYTANLIAESVYGSPAYAGTTPLSRQQRRGRSRGIPPKKIAPLSDNKPKTAPAAIFLASPMNKQLQSTKRHQSDEEKKLREEVERQKRDIALLRSQLKNRDDQLEEMGDELNRLKEETKKGRGSDSLSRKSKDKSIDSGPLSPNSVRLKALSQPRKVRPKVLICQYMMLFAIQK